MTNPFSLSEQAHQEALRQARELGDPRPALVVAWMREQTDLIRAADGTAKWTEAEPAGWLVNVMSLEHLEVPDSSTASIDDLKVYFKPRPGSSAHVRVSLTGGKFTVAEGKT